MFYLIFISINEGTFSGSRKGGKENTLTVPQGGHVTNVTMQFAPYHHELVTLAFGFSDGSKSKILGNRAKWSGLQVLALIFRISTKVS